MDVLSGQPAPGESPSPSVPVPALQILLVEDNLVNQELARLMLVRSGHQVVAVSSGLAAIEALDDASVPGGFDVVLMDLQMAGMDGLEATRIIRHRGESTRQPIIIALTANVTAEARAACRDVGMDDFLGKPIRRAELAAVLARAARSSETPATEEVPREPRPGTDREPVLDPELFGRLDDMDHETRTMILQHLLDEAGGHLVSLHAELRLGDRGQPGFLAHRLRGSSASIGASRLAAACAEIESSVHAGRVVTPEMLARLGSAIDDTTAALLNHLDPG